ncbi:MAG: deoxyribose-phosphate aldolase [Candidatus Thermochlorobacter sp.]
MAKFQPSDVAKYIDHTNLKPDATPNDIERLCKEAITYGFYAVCVNSAFVSQCAQWLAGSEVKLCTVVGFPLGAVLTEVKVKETELACQQGASEIDMVLPIGLLKAKLYSAVESDIQSVVKVATANNALVKVILETALLSDAEKVMACELAKSAGAACVKTSTGFAKTGATVEDVQLMRKAVGEQLGVKASGGIKTYKDALAMIEAGASRLGTSASVMIMEEARRVSL